MLNRNTAFLASALLIGSQIPTTIEKIQQPWLKTLLQLLALLVFLYAALKVEPSAFKPITLRPPPPKSDEPDTIPDRLPLSDEQLIAELKRRQKTIDGRY